MSGDDRSDRRGSEVNIFIGILTERNESMYHGAEAIRMSRSERIPHSTAVDAHAMKYDNKKTICEGSRMNTSKHGFLLTHLA